MIHQVLRKQLQGKLKLNERDETGRKVVSTRKLAVGSHQEVAHQALREGIGNLLAGVPTTRSITSQGRADAVGLRFQ